MCQDRTNGKSKRNGTPSSGDNEGAAGATTTGAEEGEEPVGVEEVGPTLIDTTGVCAEPEEEEV